MYEFIKHLHSGWAYVVVLLSAILFISSIVFFIKKKPVTPNLKKISFYTVLSFHLQFLIGIVLYIVSPMVKAAWENGTSMQNGIRLFTVEHPFMMFTAVILITIANVKLKKNPIIKVSTLIFMGVAMLCFYMIPWSIWLG